MGILYWIFGSILIQPKHLPQTLKLHVSEQVDVITGILLYSGVIIQDPTIIQVASQQIQQEEINEKS